MTQHTPIHPNIHTQTFEPNELGKGLGRKHAALNEGLGYEGRDRELKSANIQHPTEHTTQQQQHNGASDSAAFAKCGGLMLKFGELFSWKIYAQEVGIGKVARWMQHAACKIVQVAPFLCKVQFYSCNSYAFICMCMCESVCVCV